MSWETVETDGRQRQDDERRHRYGDAPLDGESHCERSQVELPASDVRALVAVVAVNALRLQGALRVAASAHTPVLAPDLCGRESRKQPEEYAERLAVPEPGVLAEHRHAHPGDDRIQRHQDRQCEGTKRAREYILRPGEQEEQQQRGPNVQPFRIPEGSVFLALRLSAYPLEPLERNLPWIQEHPHVAQQRRQVAHPNPPDYPDERGREVVYGPVGSYESAQQKQQKRGRRKRPDYDSRDPARKDGANQRDIQQVQARIRETLTPLLDEHPDHDERQRDRRRRPD